MKKVRWNKRKCAENLVATAVFVAAGLSLGYLFAMWAIG